MGSGVGRQRCSLRARPTRGFCCCENNCELTLAPRVQSGGCPHATSRVPALRIRFQSPQLLCGLAAREAGLMWVFADTGCRLGSGEPGPDIAAGVSSREHGFHCRRPLDARPREHMEGAKAGKLSIRPERGGLRTAAAEAGPRSRVRPRSPGSPGGVGPGHGLDGRTVGGGQRRRRGRPAMAAAGRGLGSVAWSEGGAPGGSGRWAWHRLALSRSVVPGGTARGPGGRTAGRRRAGCKRAAEPWADQLEQTPDRRQQEDDRLGAAGRGPARANGNV